MIARAVYINIVFGVTQVHFTDIQFKIADWQPFCFNFADYLRILAQ